MKLFKIKKRVFCVGVEKVWPEDRYSIDDTEIYLLPSLVFSRYYKILGIRFLRSELWFKIVNESNSPF
jgi:hypothetical protein